MCDKYVVNISCKNTVTLYNKNYFGSLLHFSKLYVVMCGSLRMATIYAEVRGAKTSAVVSSEGYLIP